MGWMMRLTHINDMDILELGHGQILEDFASQAACATATAISRQSSQDQAGGSVRGGTNMTLCLVSQMPVRSGSASSLVLVLVIVPHTGS